MRTGNSAERKTHIGTRNSREKVTASEDNAQMS